MMNKINCKSCNTNCNTMRPTYTATVGEGIVQSSNCEYFYGMCPLIEFGKEYYAMIALANPRDSGVVLYMNKMSCSNYSGVPLQMMVYATGSIPCSLDVSNKVAPGNSECTEKNVGKIYYGRYSGIMDGLDVDSRSIQPYQTHDGYPNGAIILHPGKARIYLLKVLNPRECAVTNVAFAWWEDPYY